MQCKTTQIRLRGPEFAAMHSAMNTTSLQNIWWRAS
ncbi:hypothetical protein HNQ95_005833 [Aminobacter ciceronei]|jgi:hypothetical protein|uniref:Uncharacterized protein n=2 Tax=Aminobacter TaxID=31988 RepID=A0AAC8YPI6_AMIAI|nr:hypothetical protein AA2016_2345 [Aminobacter aminovorans]MBA8910023.1 hypothetical protein [Aminobacter ciceronei]MBA9023783.1 hypothetical protein [Aminobacter ciceronei]MBB3705744.1 hypothetical protein [Aminobacter aminovorans]